MGQIVHEKYASHSVKDTTKLKQQNQRSFLKALWIVIPTIIFFFWNAVNVSLHSFMKEVQLLSFDLDSATIKALTVCLERI